MDSVRALMPESQRSICQNSMSLSYSRLHLPRALHRALAVVFFGLSVVVAVSLDAGEPPQEVGLPLSDSTLVEKLLERAEKEEESEFWTTVRKLEALGSEAVPALLERLATGTENGRIAAAKALLGIGADDQSKARAIDALESLVDSASSQKVRVAAIELASEHCEPEKITPLLEKALEGTRDPPTVIAAAKALWDLDRLPKARERLLDLLGSKDVGVRRSAAVALAEIHYFEGDVRDVLRELKSEPSQLGHRAEDLFKVIQLSRELDAAASGDSELLHGVDSQKLLQIKEDRIRKLEQELDRARSSQQLRTPEASLDAVVEEVILQIQESYVDESKTERTVLILGALKGMVRSLDEFSSFMDPEETKTFQQNMSGEYFGIGAQVNKVPDRPLEILKPVYGGPAYKAGILSGDVVLEVDGVPTAELEIQEVIDRLKGPASSTVKLKVLRRGWLEPKDFLVERRMVEVPSVYHELLPGGIGYVLLVQFGEKSADEMIKALDKLEEANLEGLILDLRNNPGGRLDAAVRVADQFVAGDLPIVTQKGRSRGGAVQEVATRPDPFKRPDYPLVVLVNERSASASEVVSGALQDFGRATLVGKRTYGKGSVQRLIPISSEGEKALGGECELRLTVQYYFLPLGRCIHTIRHKNGVVLQEGGVKPDVEVDTDRIPTWRYEERERLRNHAAVLDYIEKHSAEIQRLYLEGDDRTTDRYPDFDQLYKAVETTALREDLRLVIRFQARRQIEDVKGKESACDYQEDVQLQAAILQVLKKMGKKPEDVPRYAWMARQS